MQPGQGATLWEPRDLGPGDPSIVIKNFNINSFNVIILTFVLYCQMGYCYLFILLSYSATTLPGF